LEYRGLVNSVLNREFLKAAEVFEYLGAILYLLLEKGLPTEYLGETLYWLHLKGLPGEYLGETLY